MKQLIVWRPNPRETLAARMRPGAIDGWNIRAFSRPYKVPAADAGAFNPAAVTRRLYAQYQQRLKELNAVRFRRSLVAHGHDLPDP